MVEVVQMSLKEADRYAVIQQVIQRTIGQSDATLWLNISVRQVKPLNGRVDAVLVKESLRLRTLQALVAAENAQMRSRPSAAAI